MLKVHGQPSYLCQCHALLWSPVQQTDSNMTEWHDTLAAEVAANDQSSASHVRSLFCAVIVCRAQLNELHTLVQFLNKQVKHRLSAWFYAVCRGQAC